ncbi:MAG: UPF0280 family protein [Candidatus Omnitrophica bacterium]|nr:UPF0280 family protein [Candidatus Omnitrophota bacterium]
MRKIKFGVNQPRFYRFWMKQDTLFAFEAKVKETDLYIRADRELKKEAKDSIKRHRAPIEDFIRKNPGFQKTLKPYPVSRSMPPIIKDMAKAAEKAGVGPMAAVAGAIAEYVGRDLLKKCKEVIVENGGDIFIKVKRPVKIGIYAADSPFTNRLALKFEGRQTLLGVCASSGTVGPSLSFGKSDASIVIARSAVLADACATAAGNMIKKESDIPRAIKRAKKIAGIYGLVLIKGRSIGAWGKVKFDF